MDDVDSNPGITQHLRRAIEGDDGAMDLVFGQIGPLIEQTARCRLARTLGGVDGWEDVAGGVALGVLSKLRRGFVLEDSASGHRALLGLVSKITSDVVSDRLRSLYRKGLAKERAEPRTSGGGGGMDEFSASVTTAWKKEMHREQRDGVRVAIEQMSERDRAVLVLRGIDGIRFQTVGAQLGISEDAARMAFDRALDRLRRALPRELVSAFEAR